MERNHPVRSAQYGDYWRLLVPGEYQVEVRKRGYISEKRTIHITDGKATKKDFFLRPDANSMDESGTQLQEVQEVKEDEKKPIPVSLVIGLTVVCLISLMLALALAIMLAKKYRGNGDVQSQYSAVHTDP